MNVLNAIGNVGKDATVRYTPSGDAVAQFSFALTSGYGDKQVTTWLNCSLWGKRAETLSPMLLKGTKIGITGELTNRPYIDKQGAEKYSLEARITDITLLGSKASQADSANDAPHSAKDDDSDFSNMDDDIPF